MVVRALYSLMGRSPHARGSPFGTAAIPTKKGSIPACAGEPWRRISTLLPRGVDPRMRGGALRWCVTNTMEWGRSPHARGSRLGNECGVFLAGSIPACAGEPVPPLLIVTCIWVDPRMRGGALGTCDNVYAMSGRSPHARGSLKCGLSVAHRYGSIPACAGEPGPKGRRQERWRVDPRMRGGAADCQAGQYFIPGRSPHARGSPCAESWYGFAGGSIPACAGEPSSPSANPEVIGVDPRMRGGACSSSRSSHRVPGRSPHARGSL